MRTRRPPPRINDGATLRTSSAAARVRSTRRENKENEARQPIQQDLPRSSISTPKVKPITIHRALAAANTAVISDTVHFSTLSEHDVVDSTSLSPATVLKGLVTEGDVYYHLWVAARSVIEEEDWNCLDSRIVQRTLERFLLELGIAFYERNGGPHLTFIDPRKNDDTADMVNSAKRLVNSFCGRGLSKEKIVISIPATEDGVAAAKELETAGIHTNLMFVANVLHAAFCASAGATAVSIAVGPLLRCHERKRNAQYPDFANHPGIEIIQTTLEYFKLHGIETRIVGRDFRQLAELSALSGFDAVCLSKDQVEALRCKTTENRSGVDLLDKPPQGSLRARQVQHPAKLPGDGRPGFMRLMSARTRGMVAETLYSALGKLELQMNAIEKIVRAEVAWQLALSKLDLDALYEWWASMPPPSPDTRKRRDGETEKRVGSEKGRTPLADACEPESKVGLIEGVEYF
ncbi:putative transaldolase [Favolaschia claudopus]|uniref:Transaldolase n=1 Tax=Favolaschia claudopus TaxID=2862362 RepID=A0AAW0CTV4_9AGAR